jgi:transposase
MRCKTKLTSAEWSAIRRVLPAYKTGRPPKNDRATIARMLEAGTEGRQLDASLYVKRQRWERAGVWAKIQKAAAPAIARWREQEYRAMDDPMAKLMRSFDRQWGGRPFR